MKFTRVEFTKMVGSNLREKRTSIGFTIEKLAFDSGMDPKQLIRIELGQINTSIFQVYRLSHALNCPVHEIFIFNDSLKSIELSS